jgi:thymidine kinase
LANYSFRTSKEDELVLLGERENYEPLSRAAFFNANQKKDQAKKKNKKS